MVSVANFKNLNYLICSKKKLVISFICSKNEDEKIIKKEESIQIFLL